MKKQLEAILLSIAVISIFFTGCSKSADLVTSSTLTSSTVNSASRIDNGSQNSASQNAVTITGVFDFSTFPNTTGTFTTTGALTISGTATMYVGVISDPVAHCVVTLYAPDGTITIHQECNFKTPIPKGQW